MLENELGTNGSPYEGIFKALLNGEKLYDEIGREWSFNKGYGSIRIADSYDKGTKILTIKNLSRRPSGAPKLRPMTRWEILDWANSEASRGWVVQSRYIGNDFWGLWNNPQRFLYDTCEDFVDENVVEYRRARLLPDLSGIDESTIQGFEVEE
jgi:hypothetical protein